MVNAEYMLTTFDNPYNPFDQFELWLLFDKENNYNSCELLARFTNNSTEMSQIEEEVDIQRAIDEIVKNDPLNRYTIAFPNTSNEVENVENGPIETETTNT